MKEFWSCTEAYTLLPSTIHSPSPISPLVPSQSNILFFHWHPEPRFSLCTTVIHGEDGCEGSKWHYDRWFWSWETWTLFGWEFVNFGQIVSGETEWCNNKGGEVPAGFRLKPLRCQIGVWFENTMTTISFFFLDLGLLPASFSKNNFYTSTKHINFTFVRAIYNSYLILSNMGNYVI